MLDKEKGDFADGYVYLFRNNIESSPKIKSLGELGESLAQCVKQTFEKMTGKGFDYFESKTAQIPSFREKCAKIQVPRESGTKKIANVLI